jgi:hypothetical protein
VAALFWDMKFKEKYGKIVLTASQSPKTMLKEKYKKKKYRISENMTKIKILQDD